MANHVNSIRPPFNDPIARSNIKTMKTVPIQAKQSYIILIFGKNGRDQFYSCNNNFVFLDCWLNLFLSRYIFLGNPLFSRRIYLWGGDTFPRVGSQR